MGKLTFEKPDLDAFPCLAYAYEAAKGGGTYPAVLNAANDVAVARFLAGEIGFLRISELIREALDAHESCSTCDLAAIQAADLWTRDRTKTA
jgi:1-deoxy-D-xylulose-5-phosphate reductoisomerase